MVVVVVRKDCPSSKPKGKLSHTQSKRTKKVMVVAEGKQTTHEPKKVRIAAKTANSSKETEDCSEDSKLTHTKLRTKKPAQT